jgi:putative sterol carrier protein
MVKYFSTEFLQELAARLTQDPQWMKGASKITVKLMITITDRNEHHLLAVVNGQVSARVATPEEPADFKFEGPYEQWVRLGKEKKDIQSLVLQGKLKFRGPLAKFMPMQPTLVRIEAVAREIPAEF